MYLLRLGIYFAGNHRTEARQDNNSSVEHDDAKTTGPNSAKNNKKPPAILDYNELASQMTQNNYIYTQPHSIK